MKNRGDIKGEDGEEGRLFPVTEQLRKCRRVRKTEQANTRIQQLNHWPELWVEEDIKGLIQTWAEGESQVLKQTGVKKYCYQAECVCVSGKTYRT